MFESGVWMRVEGENKRKRFISSISVQFPKIFLENQKVFLGRDTV